jgi:AcrR family transcriptional regulator
MSERTENAPLLTGHLADGQTRERILRAAERLFAEHGYSGVSLRTIMAEAGANTASVHYYFRGKEGLLRALFDMRTGPMNAERVRLLDVCQNEFEHNQKVDRGVRRPRDPKRLASEWRSVREAIGAMFRRSESGGPPRRIRIVSRCCDALCFNAAGDLPTFIRHRILLAAALLLRNDDIHASPQRSRRLPARVLVRRNASRFRARTAGHIC